MRAGQAFAVFTFATALQVLTLLPPCESYCLYMQEYPEAKYVRQIGKLALMPQEGSDCDRCSLVDPVPLPKKEGVAMIEQRPQLGPGLPPPLPATVGKGDMRFHHVHQIADGEGRVIAVNCWHDMHWDLHMV